MLEKVIYLKMYKNVPKRDAPDIRPHNPAFFISGIRPHIGYVKANIRLSKRPDIRWKCQLVFINAGQNLLILENAVVNSSYLGSVTFFIRSIFIRNKIYTVLTI